MIDGDVAPADMRTPDRPLSVLILCDTDSQIFGTVGIARAFRDAGSAVTYGLFGKPIPDTARDVIADFPISELGIPPPHHAELVGEHDVVGFYSHGSQIQAFRTWFGETFKGPAGERPVIFTGFNGLVLEKFEEGVAWRAGYDLIAVAGTRDIDAFALAFGKTAIADQPIVACGVGFAQVTQRRPRTGTRRRLVFAEQSVIPSAMRDRVWLMGQLCRLASASPNWDVVVKVRVAPGGQTFHRVKNHMEILLDRISNVPPNFVVSAGSLSQELANADFMMTVSSTAVFEAIRSDIPAATLADFGVANATGTHVFLGSGLMLSISEIENLDALAPPAPDADWQRWIGLTGGTPSSLVEAVWKLKASGAGLPRPFYGTDGVAPLPARFGFASAVAKAEQALETGNKAAASKQLVKALQYMPDDRRAQLLKQAADGQIALWTVFPRYKLSEFADAVRWIVRKLRPRRSGLET